MISNNRLQVTDPDALAYPVTNTTAAITQRYLYGPAVDQILATETFTPTTDTVLWGLGDNEGTIRDVVDSTGSVKTHVQFTSFGADRCHAHQRRFRLWAGGDALRPVDERLPHGCGSTIPWRAVSSPTTRPASARTSPWPAATTGPTAATQRPVAHRAQRRRQ